MINDARVSIIIPVYNVKKYLIECVYSVIEQTYEQLEIILVDDGSTDGSGEICDELAIRDERIIALHKSNSGVVDSRNLGLQFATGIYCVFVDGDDWISPNFVEKMVSIFVEFNPDVVCCGFVRTDNKESLYMKNIRPNFSVGYYSGQQFLDEITPYILAGNNGKIFPNTLWGKAYRTELCKSVLPKVSPDLKYSEDGCAIALCLSICSSIYITDECLYFYRDNPFSLTANKKGKPLNTPLLLKKCWEKYLDLDCCDYKEQLYRRLFIEIFFLVQSHLNSNNRYQNIIRDIRGFLASSWVLEIINKCEFSGSQKWTIVKSLLKHKLIFPIYVYSRYALFRNKQDRKRSDA